MKLKNILRVTGMLLASSITGQALALPPTATPNYTVYTSGASAQQNTIKAMLTAYCKPFDPANPNTTGLHEYQEQYVTSAGVATTDKKGSNFRAYFCTSAVAKSFLNPCRKRISAISIACSNSFSNSGRSLSFFSLSLTTFSINIVFYLV